MSPKILVIDDDLFVSTVAAVCLTRLGDCQVLASFDGPRGVWAGADAKPAPNRADLDRPPGPAPARGRELSER